MAQSWSEHWYFDKITKEHNWKHLLHLLRNLAASITLLHIWSCDTVMERVQKVKSHPRTDHEGPERE